MARDTKSTWRRQAREVIHQVLADLPSTISERDMRKVLNAHYPFGERANHPYLCWRVEVNLAVKERGQPKTFREVVVAYSVMPQGGPRPWWLSVRCDWCKDVPTTHGNVMGCMICLNHHQTVRDVTATDDWRRWRAAMAKDPVNAPLIAADWLTDHDHPDLADALRQAATATAAGATEMVQTKKGQRS